MLPEKKKSRFGIRIKLKELVNPINLIGIVVGGIAGVFYFINADTTNGTFPITSSLFLTILWGALIGFLIADIIYQSTKKKGK